MRALATALALALAGAAGAQTPAPDCPFLAPGCERLPRLFQEFERDLAPLLRDLRREAEPRLRDLERDLAPLLDGLARRIDPYLAQLGALLGDLTAWEAPEVLPNGDILIRRRPAPAPGDQPPAEPPVTAPFEL